MPHAGQRMCWASASDQGPLLLLDRQPAALLSLAAAAFYGWVEIRFGAVTAAVTVAYRMHAFRNSVGVHWASSGRRLRPGATQKQSDHADQCSVATTRAAALGFRGQSLMVF